MSEERALGRKTGESHVRHERCSGGVAGGIGQDNDQAGVHACIATLRWMSFWSDMWMI